MAKDKDKQPEKIRRVFILDEETAFLYPNKNGDKLILSQADLSIIDGQKKDIEAIVILSELDWEGHDLQSFHGYQIAYQLLSTIDLKSYFNLLFISTLSQETLYNTIKDRNRIFVKSYTHRVIDNSFNFRNLNVPAISCRKFEYLRKYCLTESGILDKLEHDIRPGKNLSDSQAKNLIQDLHANVDLLGNKVMQVLKDTTASNFKHKQRDLHEQIILRIQEIGGMKEKAETSSAAQEITWKPRLLLLEDSDAQREKMKGYLDTYFDIQPENNGAAAIDYLKREAENVSVAICDMELLQCNNLDQEVQGIDVLEHIKTNCPHIVLKVVSHLPRRGLKVLLGDMLSVSDLIYKSMLLDGNPDFISDLVTEINREVDLNKSLQRLRGPSKALWANYTRQGGSGGRFKYFYYSLRNDSKWRKEFEHMWEEIDEEIKKVTDGSNQISSKFGQVKSRSTNDMAFQEAIEFLKELLINRLFWICELYSGPTSVEIEVDSYRNYFSNDFILYSENKNRTKNYFGNLLGFETENNSKKSCSLKFGQLFEEEYDRKMKLDNKLAFDLQNSHLINEIQDILEVIIKSPAHSKFKKAKYPTLNKFLNHSNQLVCINSILTKLASEMPTSALRRQDNKDRGKITSILQTLCDYPEFHTYPIDLRSNILYAIEAMESQFN